MGDANALLREQAFIADAVLISLGADPLAGDDAGVRQAALRELVQMYMERGYLNSKMSDADVRAIAVYVKDLPAGAPEPAVTSPPRASSPPPSIGCCWSSRAIR